MTDNVRHSSKSNEHFTPQHVVDAARAVMNGFDLDPASSRLGNEQIQAHMYLDLQLDKIEPSLKRDWVGRVFLNPPGGVTEDGSSQKLWWFKLAAEYLSGRVTQALFVGFSVEMLQTTQVNSTVPLLPLDFPLCFPSRRLAYSREMLTCECAHSLEAHFDETNPEPTSCAVWNCKCEAWRYKESHLIVGKQPPHASVLVYLPPRLLTEPAWIPQALSAFREHFGKIGRVVVPAQAAAPKLASVRTLLPPIPTVGSREPSLVEAVMGEGKHLLNEGAPKKPTTETENLSQLVDDLGLKGVIISLPTVCQWSRPERIQARAWIVGLGAKPSFLEQEKPKTGCYACDRGIGAEPGKEYLHTCEIGDGPAREPEDADVVVRDGKPFLKEKCPPGDTCIACDRLGYHLIPAGASNETQTTKTSKATPKEEKTARPIPSVAKSSDSAREAQKSSDGIRGDGSDEDANDEAPRRGKGRPRSLPTGSYCKHCKTDTVVAHGPHRIWCPTCGYVWDAPYVPPADAWSELARLAAESAHPENEKAFFA